MYFTTDAQGRLVINATSATVLLPMRYDLTQPILDLLGNPMSSATLPGPNGENDPDAPNYTLGLVLFRAALFVESGTNPPAEEKFRQAQLAEKIYKGNSSVDLSTEEMAKLRLAVGRMYGPTIVFRGWSMIDVHSADVH